MEFTQQLIEFAGNHLILVGALVVVSALLIHNLVSTGGGGKDSLDPRDAVNLINREDAVVVDVRPAADFRKGHIVNAINMPMSGFTGDIQRLNKYKGKPILVSCRSGAQSAVACRQLRKQGFDPVYNLHGGILAWESANLPVSRKG